MAEETKKRINVYLTDKEKAQFADVAEVHQRSVSSMARSLIVNAIKDNQSAMTIDSNRSE